LELDPSARKPLLATYNWLSKEVNAAVAAGPAGADKFAYLRPENQTPAALRKRYITILCLSKLLHRLLGPLLHYTVTVFAALLTLALEHLTSHFAHSSPPPLPCFSLQRSLKVCARFCT